MAVTFVSEPLEPLEASFDPDAMSAGAPGLPRGFRWRGQELIIAEVLQSGKEHGDCRHGSGERYLRKHVFRLRTTDGRVLRVYFQRSATRPLSRQAKRWWLHSLEEAPNAGSPGAIRARQRPPAR